MLLNDRATKETMMDTDILQIMSRREDKIRQQPILVYIGIDGTLGCRLETQVLQDTSAGAADPHVDEATAKGDRTDDRGAAKGQAAPHDEGIQRRRTENAV